MSEPRRKRSTTLPYGIKGADLTRLAMSIIVAGVVSYFAIKYSVERNTESVGRNAGAIEAMRQDRRALEQRVVKLEATLMLVQFRQSQHESLGDIGKTLAEIRDAVTVPRWRRR